MGHNRVSLAYVFSRAQLGFFLSRNNNAKCKKRNFKSLTLKKDYNLSSVFACAISAHRETWHVCQYLQSAGLGDINLPATRSLISGVFLDKLKIQLYYVTAAKPGGWAWCWGSPPTAASPRSRSLNKQIKQTNKRNRKVLSLINNDKAMINL